MATERPPRRMDPYAEQFWQFTRSKEFRLQRCAACGRFRWPPAPVCDGCLSEDFSWTAVSGKGTVLSWVTFHRGYFPEYPPPHTVVMVELAEGPLFITIPVDIARDELSDGMRMEVAWVEARDRFGDYHLPVFRPGAETGDRR